MKERSPTASIASSLFLPEVNAKVLHYYCRYCYEHLENKALSPHPINHSSLPSPTIFCPYCNNRKSNLVSGGRRGGGTVLQYSTGLFSALGRGETNHCLLGPKYIPRSITHTLYPSFRPGCTDTMREGPRSVKTTVTIISQSWGHLSIISPPPSYIRCPL